MQKLGLVQYTQPSDIKRSYPEILVVEVNKPDSPAHRACLVVKAINIPALIHRYRASADLPSYQFPKVLLELNITEQQIRYWIPTKIKVYEEVVSVIRDCGRLLDRRTNVKPTTALLAKPNRFSGERGLTTTPCIGICSTTNTGDIICRGCGRTSKQVIDWNTYTDDEKSAINIKLKSLL